jgi:hypothetical protein
MGRTWVVVAVVGALLFAAGGFVMGAMNAGWLGLERDVNSMFPLLGLGVLAMMAGWSGGVGRTVWASGALGKAATVMALLGGLFFLLNPILQVAIFGTLLFGFGLGLFSVALWRKELMGREDHLLASFAAIGSLTWNTETLSAFLLVGVGALLALLSMRMGKAD